MKNIFKISFAVALIALCATSCYKPSIYDEEYDETVKISVATPLCDFRADGKTVNGDDYFESIVVCTKDRYNVDFTVFDVEENEWVSVEKVKITKHFSGTYGDEVDYDQPGFRVTVEPNTARTKRNINVMIKAADGTTKALKFSQAGRGE